MKSGIDYFRHNFKESRLSVILTIISVIIWAVGLTQSQLTYGFFGIIHSYNFLILVSLILITISSVILWKSSENHSKLLCLQLVLFITIIKLTPVLIGGNPLFAMNLFRDFPEAEYISTFGHLNPSDPALWYHNWPGLYIIQSLFITLFGVTTPDIFAYFGEYLMQIVLILPLYVFFRSIVKEANYRWAGCWLFCMGYSFFAVYFNPQGFGLLLVLILLALLFNSSCEGRRPSAGLIISSTIIFAAIVVTHFLTSVFAALCILPFVFMRRTFAYPVALLSGLLLAGWLILGASYMFEGHLPGFIERAFDAERWFAIILGAVSSTSGDTVPVAAASVTVTSLIKAGFMIIFSAIGITGFLLAVRKRNNTFNLIIVLIIAACFIGIATFYDKVGSIDRAYLYSMAPLCFLCLISLRHRKTQVIVIVLLVLLLPFRIIASDGYMGIIHYLPRSEAAYFHFVQENTRDSDIIGGASYLSPRYKYYRFHKVEYQDDMYITSQNTTQLVHIGIFDRNKYLYGPDDCDPYLVPQVEKNLESSRYYNLVYGNPLVSIFENDTLRTNK